MNTATLFETRRVAPDTDALAGYLPLPGYGVLPVNAYVLHAREPMLIDTGLAALGDDFIDALSSVVDPATLTRIWITHMDADHIGNLQAVLTRAPEARIITTYLGMGKMGLLGLPQERAYLLNPGQVLDLGDRVVKAVAPPTFDAPETTGLYDTSSGTLFSADCFGAMMNEPAESASGIRAEALREGMVAWATVDAPWLAWVDEARFHAACQEVRELDPAVVLSSHLPPAAGMTATLLEHLDAARSAPRFEGPDQAALEAMMASQAA